MQYNFDELRPYCTPRQWEMLDTWQRMGSVRKAAKALGIQRQTIQDVKRIVENKRDHGAGFARSGFTTLYKGGEDVDGLGAPVMQWVKHPTPAPARQSDTDRAEFWKSMREDLLAGMPRTKARPFAGHTFKDRCVVYPVGDQHNGMLAWKHESGESWDVAISERTLQNAIDYLVAAMPPARYAVVAVLGDFFHYDSHRPETPQNRNLLDADGRFGKMYRSGIRLARYVIERALEKHEMVHVIWLKGNHDPSTAQTVAYLLEALYENEPRVTVDTTPAFFSYYRFGDNLFGFTHGDKTKAAQLGPVMATDRAKDWGECSTRVWFTGHWHTKRIEDHPGVTVETMRVLPPGDAWAHGAGYRSIRGMEAIMYHKKFGEVMRLPVKPMMFETPGPEEDE